MWGPLMLNLLIDESPVMAPPYISYPYTHDPVVVTQCVCECLNLSVGPIVQYAAAGQQCSHSSSRGLLLLKEPLCPRKAGMPVQLHVFGKHWAKSQRNHWAMEYHIPSHPLPLVCSRWKSCCMEPLYGGWETKSARAGSGGWSTDNWETRLVSISVMAKLRNTDVISSMVSEGTVLLANMLFTHAADMEQI